MDKTILHKYTGRPTPEPEAPAAPDESGADDFVVFGWLRSSRERCPMLELRRRSGNIMAVGYGWMERAEFDPSAGITLWIPGHIVRIGGRNLNAEVRPGARLFEGIARHRVPWLREASRAEAMEAHAAACVIESIEW